MSSVNNNPNTSAQHLEISDDIKPKVGLVGEILVKFHPLANNSLVDNFPCS